MPKDKPPPDAALLDYAVSKLQKRPVWSSPESASSTCGCIISMQRSFQNVERYLYYISRVS